MKTLPLLMLILLSLCVSCISNPLDSKLDDNFNKNHPLRSISTKSCTIDNEDSLVVMSKIQKDANHLMMNRIIYKDSAFILGIKREDARFLGVPDDVYEKYLEYVENLNKTGNFQQ